ARWFSDTAELDARPGGAGLLTFEDRATGRGGTVRMRVEAAEPPYRLAFRWDFPAGEEPTAQNAPLVEVTLTPQGAGTRLRMVESGLAALRRPEEEKTAYAEGHDKGWDVHLGSLRDYVATLA